MNEKAHSSDEEDSEYCPSDHGSDNEESDDELETKQAKRARRDSPPPKPTGPKPSIDDLWASLNAPYQPPKRAPAKPMAAAPIPSATSSNSKIAPSPDKTEKPQPERRAQTEGLKPDAQGMISVTRVCDFAGETITTTVRVAADSKEGRAALKEQEEARQASSAPSSLADLLSPTSTPTPIPTPPPHPHTDILPGSGCPLGCHDKVPMGQGKAVCHCSDELCIDAPARVVEHQGLILDITPPSSTHPHTHAHTQAPCLPLLTLSDPQGTVSRAVPVWRSEYQAEPDNQPGNGEVASWRIGKGEVKRHAAYEWTQTLLNGTQKRRIRPLGQNENLDMTSQPGQNENDPMTSIPISKTHDPLTGSQIITNAQHTMQILTPEQKMTKMASSGVDSQKDRIVLLGDGTRILTRDVWLKPPSNEKPEANVGRHGTHEEGGNECDGIGSQGPTHSARTHTQSHTYTVTPSHTRTPSRLPSASPSQQSNHTHTSLHSRLSAIYTRLHSAQCIQPVLEHQVHTYIESPHWPRMHLISMENHLNSVEILFADGSTMKWEHKGSGTPPVVSVKEPGNYVLRHKEHLILVDPPYASQVRHTSTRKKMKSLANHEDELNSKRDRKRRIAQQIREQKQLEKQQQQDASPSHAGMPVSGARSAHSQRSQTPRDGAGGAGAGEDDNPQTGQNENDQEPDQGQNEEPNFDFSEEDLEKGRLPQGVYLFSLDSATPASPCQNQNDQAVDEACQNENDPSPVATPSPDPTPAVETDEITPTPEPPLENEADPGQNEPPTHPTPYPCFMLYDWDRRVFRIQPSGALEMDRLATMDPSPAILGPLRDPAGDESAEVLTVERETVSAHAPVRASPLGMQVSGGQEKEEKEEEEDGGAVVGHGHEMEGMHTGAQHAEGTESEEGDAPVQQPAAGSISSRQHKPDSAPHADAQSIPTPAHLHMHMHTQAQAEQVSTLPQYSETEMSLDEARRELNAMGNEGPQEGADDEEDIDEAPEGDRSSMLQPRLFVIKPDGAGYELHRESDLAILLYLNQHRRDVRILQDEIEGTPDGYATTLYSPLFALPNCSCHNQNDHPCQMGQNQGGPLDPAENVFSLIPPSLQAVLGTLSHPCHNNRARCQNLCVVRQLINRSGATPDDYCELINDLSKLVRWWDQRKQYASSLVVHEKKSKQELQKAENVKMRIQKCRTCQVPFEQAFRPNISSQAPLVAPKGQPQQQPNRRIHPQLPQTQLERLQHSTHAHAHSRLAISTTEMEESPNSAEDEQLRLAQTGPALVPADRKKPLLVLESHLRGGGGGGAYFAPPIMDDIGERDEEVPEHDTDREMRGRDVDGAMFVEQGMSEGGALMVSTEVPPMAQAANASALLGTKHAPTVENLLQNPAEIDRILSTYRLNRGSKAAKCTLPPPPALTLPASMSEDQGSTHADLHLGSFHTLPASQPSVPVSVTLSGVSVGAEKDRKDMKGFSTRAMCGSVRQSEASLREGTSSRSISSTSTHDTPFESLFPPLTDQPDIQPHVLIAECDTDTDAHTDTETRTPVARTESGRANSARSNVGEKAGSVKTEKRTQSAGSASSRKIAPSPRPAPSSRLPLLLTPGELDFGQLTPGARYRRTLTVQNTGADTLKYRIAFPARTVTKHHPVVPSHLKQSSEDEEERCVTPDFVREVKLSYTTNTVAAGMSSSVCVEYVPQRVGRVSSALTLMTPNGSLSVPFKAVVLDGPGVNSSTQHRAIPSHLAPLRAHSHAHVSAHTRTRTRSQKQPR
eukprot:gnl/Trimastix_PCT/3335.p1 GENE.gnl/Trimastix_PCT/3335~~gnl/Trimastix_PCT/3335.p1  ORF type:complete len:1766 (-),score=206.47 gnl/Trimastix_PCT/3335:555-5822(-)